MKEIFSHWLLKLLLCAAGLVLASVGTLFVLLNISSLLALIIGLSLAVIGGGLFFVSSAVLVVQAIIVVVEKIQLIKACDEIKEIGKENYDRAVSVIRKFGVFLSMKVTQNWAKDYSDGDASAEAQGFIEKGINNNADFEKAARILYNSSLKNAVNNEGVCNFSDLNVRSSLDGGSFNESLFEKLKEKVYKYALTIQCKYDGLKDKFNALLDKVRQYDKKRENDFKNIIESRKEGNAFNPKNETDMNQVKEILDFFCKSPFRYRDPNIQDSPKYSISILGKDFNSNSGVCTTLQSYVQERIVEDFSEQQKKISKGDIVEKFFSFIEHDKYRFPNFFHVAPNMRSGRKWIITRDKIQIKLEEDRIENTAYFEQELPDLAFETKSF